MGRSRQWFYNRSMKSWLQDNDIEMDSAHNVERFIITLKNKHCQYKTSVSKYEYINKLNDIVNKYNNSHHSTIKLKSIDVKLSIYLDFDKK